MRLNIKLLGLLFSILLFVTESISAVVYESMIVFGDSYSDSGNENGVYNISGGLYPPSPPYFEGKPSNGPVWVEYLSKQFGIPLVNYAADGATSNSMTVPSASGFNDEIIVPGVRQQVNTYVNYAHASAINDKNNTNLYAVVPLGIDYIYSIKHQHEMVTPEQVIGELMTNIQTLIIEIGAQHIMVSTMPDLSNLPGFSKSDETERASLTEITKTHNELIREGLVALSPDFKKAKFHILETDKFFEQFSSEKFKETCLTINNQGSQVCDDPDNYVFWDNIHITTKVHEMLASSAFTLLQ